MAMLLIAQATFVAVHAPAPNDEWFPDRATMSAMVRADLEWMSRERRAALPAWVEA
jgi:hypothetical protein